MNKINATTQGFDNHFSVKLLSNTAEKMINSNPIICLFWTLPCNLPYGCLTGKLST